MKAGEAARRELRRIGRSAETFVSEPASALPLAALRIGTAAVLIVQACFIAPSLSLFYGSHGIVQQPVNDTLIAYTLPRIALLMRLLRPVVTDENLILVVCFSLYVVALHMLAAGWYTRTAAVASWILHLAFKTSGYSSAYGVFEFSTIALFYCSVMPVGDALGIDARLRPRQALSAGHRLSLRVLQLHICVVYLTSGLEKIRGSQWRDGEAIWRAVMRPGFDPVDLSWLASNPWIPFMAGWATLIIEIGYAVFVWPRRTRRVWAMATIGLHIGIGFMLGLWSFSAMMIVLNTAAFLIPAGAVVTRRWVEGEVSGALPVDARVSAPV